MTNEIDDLTLDLYLRYKQMSRLLLAIINSDSKFASNVVEAYSDILIREKTKLLQVLKSQYDDLVNLDAPREIISSKEKEVKLIEEILEELSQADTNYFIKKIQKINSTIEEDLLNESTNFVITEESLSMKTGGVESDKWKRLLFTI